MTAVHGGDQRRSCVAIAVLSTLDGVWAGTGCGEAGDHDRVAMVDVPRGRLLERLPDVEHLSERGW